MSNNGTDLNESKLTAINTGVGNTTMINNTLYSSNNLLKTGEILSGKYKITKALRCGSGEADLYICVFENTQYVAKLYHRKQAIKQEVIDTLMRISSPYIAKLYEVGTFEGKPYEILPYYSNGSLEGERFSSQQIKSIIIPCINEALNVLHKNSIIHKDLKPSNIMLSEDRAHVVLIDFGISSVVEGGNTVLITKTGMTPEYSAPEALRSVFLEESDYYSFGITLYELLCGHTPYHGMSTDEIARYMSVQRLPFPEEIPLELHDLITGLTYNDLTNRRDASNPNRRWTYTEVADWLKGKKYILPGTGTAELKKLQIPAYSFLQHEYHTVPELVQALLVNWSYGKKQLYRGLLSGFFKNFNPEKAGYCIDAEEAVSRLNADEDLVFFRLLYQLDPNLRSFFWDGFACSSLREFGDIMLNELWANDDDYNSLWNTVFEKGLISEYLTAIHTAEELPRLTVKSIERAYAARGKEPRSRKILYYQMAYLLSGKRDLHIGGQIINELAELTKYMGRLLEQSMEEFSAFSHLLIDDNGILCEQFEAWLLSLGKQKELAMWKETSLTNEKEETK